MGNFSRNELQLLNQLHCRRKRRHRTIFTDEQLEALEGLFQETKYPDVGTREQLARKVHLREEKVEVRGVTFILFYFFLQFAIIRLFVRANIGICVTHFANGEVRLNVLRYLPLSKYAYQWLIKVYPNSKHNNSNENTLYRFTVIA